MLRRHNNQQKLRKTKIIHKITKYPEQIKNNKRIVEQCLDKQVKTRNTKVFNMKSVKFDVKAKNKVVFKKQNIHRSFSQE